MSQATLLERRGILGGSKLSYKQTILSEPGLLAYWRFGANGGVDEKGYADVSFIGPVVETGKPSLITGDADPSFRPAPSAASVGGAWTAENASKFPRLRNLNGDFTVECWIAPTSNQSEGFVIAQTGGDWNPAATPPAPGTWHLMTGPVGSGPTVRARVIGSTPSEVVSGSLLFNGVAKYHVMMTFNNTDKKVRLYINGVLVGTGAALVGPAASGVGASDIKFNWGLDGQGHTGHSFIGYIDEGAVYDGEKSAAVALAHYNKGL